MDGITLEELNVVIKAQTEGFRRELQNVQNEVSRMTSNVNKQMNQIKNIFSSVGKFIVGLGIGKIFKDSIISAMEAIEGENLFETVFGKLSGEMRQWSDDLQNTLGINAYSARNNAAVLFNIASSMGVVRKEALGLSKDMTLLSEDMASFYNISSDEAFNKIRSGLTGETEPLKALGILVDENTLKQYGYNSEMSNSEKIMVRYQAILAQTSTAQGDLARTLDSPANQLRILRNNLSLLSIELGRAFMPIVQTVLPIINSFVLVITNAVRAVSTFMQALFGKSAKVAEGPKIATNTMYKAKNAAIGGANAQNGYNKALKKTGDTAKKTAKEVNRLLGGFDEINSLSNSGTSGGGLPGAGGAVGGVGDVGAPPLDLGFSEEPDVSGVESAVNKVKELFKPLEKAFASLKASAEPVINNIGRILKWFLDEVLIPLGKWTISDLLPAFLEILAGALDILNPILEVFMDLGKWLWDEFLQPIASWTGGVIVDILNGLADVLKTIGAWMKEHKSIIEVLVVIVGSFGLALGIVTGAVKALILVGSIWHGITVALSTVTSVLSGAMAFLTSPIGSVVVAITAVIAIGILLVKHWDEVKAKAIEVWDNVKNKFNQFKEWLSGVFSRDWSKNFGSFGDILNAFFRNVSNIFNGVKSVFNGIINFVKGVFTGNWRQAWNGVKEIFKGIVNTFSGIIKSPLNAVIGLINGAISGLNKISVDIPDWVPGFGGKTFGVNIPKIPYLAKGGIVDSATLSVIGEQGKEVVMPLENNTGWITQLAEKVATRMPDNGGSDTSSISGDIIFQIDGSVIGKVALKQLRKMQRQGGITIIPV